MYNNAPANALAVTGGGAGVFYLGWWAVAAVVLGVAILLALRHRARRNRHAMFNGE